MSYYQKFVTPFAGKKWVLLLAVGFFTITSMAQDRANFSGEWKFNESKSELVGLFPLCIFGNDRMRSKTMKIATQADFLTVDVATSSANGELVTRQAKLTFEGKENETTFVGSPRNKSTARWSDDGQTMTVKSIRSFDPKGETADFKVTEVWKLINDGKSISVQVTSSSTSGEKTMNLVYDKQWAADYRF
ncbi:MAG: hypothetical protein C0490_04495 [Marivirga sp.]|nr:hypothetical protein [Marivirga sp.]